VTFFGFPLTVAQAFGTAGDAGWFFAFAEQPTEPRFGLDEPPEQPVYGAAPAAWNHLTWASVVPGREALDALEHVPLDVPFPRSVAIPVRDDRPGADTFRWAENAAHTAHITLQRPVLLAIHATDLLAGISGEWRITHVVKGAPGTGQRRILAVAGTNRDGRVWRLTVEEAVAAVRRHERLYVDHPTAGRAEVSVVRSRRGREYLRTRAGGGTGNNLLLLPTLDEDGNA
jgi:hypothetical protein